MKANPFKRFVTILLLIEFLYCSTTEAGQEEIHTTRSNNKYPDYFERPDREPKRITTSGTLSHPMLISARQALEFQLGRLIEQTISETRGEQLETNSQRSSNDNFDMGQSYVGKSTSTKHQAQPSNPTVVGVETLDDGGRSREYAQEGLALPDTLLDRNPQANPQLARIRQRSARTEDYNKATLLERDVDDDGEEIRIIELNSLHPGHLQARPKAHKRKRRTSATSARNSSNSDYQHNNSVQSLASNLLVWDMERAYKPKTISTARGFGKRSRW